MKKITFLATSDLHSDLKLIQKIEKELQKTPIDFILITGDISEKKDDFGKLLGIFNKKQIFMVPGNHESKKQLKILQENYNVHLVGNSPVLVHENLVLFGSNYIGIGRAGLHEEDIFHNMVDNFNSIKDIKTKIFLTHLPPHDTIMGNASPYFPLIGGSIATRVFLENFKVDLTFVGHIHETSGLEEIVNENKVINLARTFKIFEFNPKTSKITELIKNNN